MSVGRSTIRFAGSRAHVCTLVAMIGAVFLPLLAPKTTCAQVPVQVETIDKKKEYTIKAIYVLTFAKNITWPTAKSKKPLKEFTIGVYGTSPFAAPMKKIAQSQKVKKGDKKISLTVKQIKSISEKNSCQILFIPQDVTVEERSKLTTYYANKPVLLVGESASFARDGGTTGFVIMNGGVTFNLNLADAKRKGLKPNAKILRSVNSVYQELAPVRSSTKPSGKNGH